MNQVFEYTGERIPGLLSELRSDAPKTIGFIEEKIFSRIDQEDFEPFVESVLLELAVAIDFDYKKTNDYDNYYPKLLNSVIEQEYFSLRDFQKYMKHEEIPISDFIEKYIFTDEKRVSTIQ